MHPKFAKFMAGKPDSLLIDSLRLVDAKENPNAYERMVRAALIEELENRYPDASAAVEIAFDSAQNFLMETGVERELDYVAILLDAIPA